MKTKRADRNSVIGREDSITIASSKNFKDMVIAESEKMGISLSSFVRMAISEYLRNHK
jgi:hypothetical protein